LQNTQTKKNKKEKRRALAVRRLSLYGCFSCNFPAFAHTDKKDGFL
jgi:hypothetical protein